MPHNLSFTTPASSEWTPPIYSMLPRPRVRPRSHQTLSQLPKHLKSVSDTDSRAARLSRSVSVHARLVTSRLAGTHTIGLCVPVRHTTLGPFSLRSHVWHTRPYRPTRASHRSRLRHVWLRHCGRRPSSSAHSAVCSISVGGKHRLQLCKLSLGRGHVRLHALDRKRERLVLSLIHI